MSEPTTEELIRRARLQGSQAAEQAADRLESQQRKIGELKAKHSDSVEGVRQHFNKQLTTLKNTLAAVEIDIEHMKECFGMGDNYRGNLFAKQALTLIKETTHE